MIEDLIYQELLKIDSDIAQYDSKKAVFFQQAPNDKAKKWGELQYPRVVYNSTWQYNQERKTSGTIQVEVYCNNESVTTPEQIEISIINQLNTAFLTENNTSYCLLWDRTDKFDVQGSEPQVFGCAISFSIYEFPFAVLVEDVCQPELSLAHYVKSLIPNAVVLGIDEIAPVYKPTDDAPVIYCRIVSTRDDFTYSALAWLLATINTHIIAQTFQGNNTLSKKIHESLLRSIRLVTNNDTYMLCQSSNLDNTRNQLRDGQIVSVFRYASVNPAEVVEKIDNANTSYKGGIENE